MRGVGKEPNVLGQWLYRCSFLYNLPDILEKNIFLLPLSTAKLPGNVMPTCPFLFPFFSATNHPAPAYWLGLLSKFCFEKIQWNRLGILLVIPRKKVLLPQNSVCLGKVLSLIRNETERSRIARKNDVLRNSQHN
jgi:hypothetical protein